MATYESICRNKTAQYTYFLPIALGLTFGGVAAPAHSALFARLRAACDQLGILFQAQVGRMPHGPQSPSKVRLVPAADVGQAIPVLRRVCLARHFAMRISACPRAIAAKSDDTEYTLHRRLGRGEALRGDRP